VRWPGGQDVSIFPLAIPLISGPGTITAVVILTGQAAGDPVRLGLVALAIVLTMLVQWLVLLGAEPLLRVLGVTGVHVSSRVMGTLLSALAVQMILDGARAAGIVR
jgi:multiple antibiotic resistance protein